ncbi:MAG: nucleotide exchange factor GrpE [Thermodesulfovibrionales bacterium]|nr:nucleotide exchange factor GrpE [Thermodesulfovibrionales bacterium]
MEEDRTDREAGEETPETVEIEGEEEVAEENAPEGKSIEEELGETKDKYLRLYAEFENYKKRMLKDKEELIRYANESIVYNLLPSIDNLEIALKHSGNSEGIKEGVEITMRELLRTLERFGLKPIESSGRPFDPEFHHAMSQVQSDEAEENTVIEEFRRGYTYWDKVLRAALVAVSKKPVKDEDSGNETGAEDTENTTDIIEEEG